jgi:hypothetical protein
MHPTPTPTPVPSIRQFPLLLSFIVLIVLSLCLVAFQPPPPDGTGSGTIHVQVVYATGTSAGGVTVRYLDEWQRRSYGACITDGQGACQMMVENAPTLGVMLRGVLEIEGSDRVQDAMLMVNETVTVSVMLDLSGTVSVDADVLATRNPNATPTLITVEDALATLTAAASEPLATPSPGIERTVASAHRAMTATTVARASLTSTPRLTPTATTIPNIGVAVIVNNTPVLLPDVATPPEDSPAEGVTVAALSAYLLRFVFTLMVGGVLLFGGGAWWVRRDDRGAP